MKKVLLHALLVPCLWLGGMAHGQNFAIDSFTIAGGGGTSTGGGFAVSGTVGQPASGAVSGGPFSLVGGFWGVVSGIPTPGAPLLAISQLGGTVVVSWPRPANGFVLDQSSALTTPPSAISWSTVPPSAYQTNTTRISITVPMPVGNKFYRLRRP